MRKKCKTLSIIIPSYNSQEYLERCINSIPLDIVDDVDIIIVNDGSEDETITIAKKYKQKYPKIVQIIDKKNGGHGSAINEAIKVATGKYIRVLDSDDWFNISSTQAYFDILRNANEDLILTNYSYNYTREDVKELVDVFNEYKKTKKISDILKENISDHDFVSFISIHSCTVKTESLKKVWQNGLLENTFYEDQEFVAKIILATETVKVLDLDIYQYLVGRDGQSMSPTKLFQRRKDHEKVLGQLVDMYAKCRDNEKKEILAKRIREMFKTHYWIYFYHIGLTKNERFEFKKAKAKLAIKLPSISKNISWRFRLRLFIGRLKNTMLK